MNKMIEKICAWGGMVFAVTFFVGFVLFAKFFPPLSPNDSAERIAEIYADNLTGIRIGLAMCYFGTMFFLAFGGAIAGQTRRIKGVSQTVIIVQIASFAAAMLLLVIPLTTWFAAAFRADTQPAANVQLMNDFGWITFVIGFPPFVAWIVATGIAILSDTSERPVFPRWSGYFSLLMACIQALPPIMLIFFKTGPFAWNGLFSWYIPLTDFFLWFVVFTVLTLRAIKSSPDGTEADESASPEWIGPSEERIATSKPSTRRT